MADLNVVATEVFQTLRSFDYTVRPYDEHGMSVAEPADARRMMCYPKNLMVSLVDDDDNSRITLNLGKSVHINDIMGLVQKLRTIATKYNMIFKAQQYGRQITPNDFAQLASISEDTAMQMGEGMYGTSRSSYLKMENARMIVRHKSRIDDSRIGARGRCVETVFVENKLGERNRMPTPSLMAGRAMTQHVNQGGSFVDPVGQQIGSMAMQYSNLGVGAGAAISEAASLVREACQCKMGKLREAFARLTRPSSYAAEAEALGQSEMLTETVVEEARLAEVRQLLNGDVSKEVVECCCKALDEMELFEAPRAIPTKLILGSPVEVAAWDAFMNGIVQVRHRPIFRHVRNKIEDLALTLGQLAEVVKDDGLANLFDKVAQQLPIETDEERKKIYRTIAVKALQAAHRVPTKEGGLAENNDVIAEHIGWLHLFDPDRILTEVAFDPMDPSFDEAPYELAASDALDNFDAKHFVDSPQMQDIIGGREPHSDENHLTEDEIMSALKMYMRRYIDIYHPAVIGGFDDASDLAKEVYEPVVNALQERGYVVEDEGLVEDVASEDELTIEDVLLPKKDQAANLAAEIAPTDVVDPDDPERHGPPDERYKNRLMTLAGIKLNPLI